MVAGEFERLLAARRSQLESSLTASDQRLAEIRSSRIDTPADDEHDPEGSMLSGEWSAAAGMREAAEQELAEIVAAADRLRAGTYGVCEVCGRGIPIERLRIRPAAVRCVVCAALPK
jgi:RNA polymerase-binding transcription factor DksA